ncbi:hypothetical protein EU545_05905 [Candidatus Thorarchaeota archaeon]|nr:MAG: hypothetical protein EU545_05905 [Candidatus Thorarchaeota archaeon]
MEEKFKQEMREVCEEYYGLLREREVIDEQLENLRNYMEITMKKYDREEYDEPDVPIEVHRMKYTREGMRRGAKDTLREILTDEQWSKIYEEREIESLRISRKDD